jgi:signal transduction histidine kinase
VKPWRRVSLTVVLTAAVVVLLPLLAVLQYHWLSRIGEEGGDRLRAVALSAADAMSSDLSFELGHAWRDRVEPTGDSDEHAEAPTLVRDALVLDWSETAGLRVRRWDLDARRCEPAEWPANFGERPQDDHRAIDMLLRRSTALAIVPIEFGVNRGRPPGVRPPCDESDSGIVVFRLDATVLRDTLVPEVARRHLASLQGDDFEVAIVSGAPGVDVIYASPGADAASIAARPDVILPLTLGEADRARRGGRGRGGREGVPPPPVEGRGRIVGRGLRGEPGEGWVFVAQHRAGSLETAVTRLRARNLALSLGILSVLGIAVALLAVSARRAERLANQQVEFVAAVSHEMRTPVTGIETAARNLEDGLVTDPARVQRYGAVIRAEARRLAETVEHVLQFAALEAGRGVGPAVDVDVRAVIDDVVARVRADHPQATVDVSVEDEAAHVRGDSTALRSAVQNLLTNALKYGGTPAWAAVRVARAAAPVAEVWVAVEDRGPGIDPDDVSHVFEPFYRGRLATDRRIPGNGLGLHIVKRSVEALGGRVSLRTDRGSGTVITLHLPLMASVDTTDGEPTTPAAGRG